MEGLELIALALFSSSALSELIGKFLREINSKIDEKRHELHKILNFMIVFTSCVFVFSFLSALLTASTFLLYSSISSQERPPLSDVMITFFLLFVLGLIFTHLIGYCFSGLLNRWPANGKYWPKAIDYIYYAFGCALLAIVIAQIYGDRSMVRCV